jgi:Fe-S cluster biosynthesis and repair protein YggX
VCWQEWLKTQQQLINHYGLNVRDPKAKEFLFANMEKFLFGEDSVKSEK